MSSASKVRRGVVLIALEYCARLRTMANMVDGYIFKSLYAFHTPNGCDFLGLRCKFRWYVLELSQSRHSMVAVDARTCNLRHSTVYTVYKLYTLHFSV